MADQAERSGATSYREASSWSAGEKKISGPEGWRSERPRDRPHSDSEEPWRGWTAPLVSQVIVGETPLVAYETIGETVIKAARTTSAWLFEIYCGIDCKLPSTRQNPMSSLEEGIPVIP